MSGSGTSEVVLPISLTEALAIRGENAVVRNTDGSLDFNKNTNRPSAYGVFTSFIGSTAQSTPIRNMSRNIALLIQQLEKLGLPPADILNALNGAISKLGPTKDKIGETLSCIEMKDLVPYLPATLQKSASALQTPERPRATSLTQFFVRMRGQPSIINGNVVFRKDTNRLEIYRLFTLATGQVDSPIRVMSKENFNLILELEKTHTPQEIAAALDKMLLRNPGKNAEIILHHAFADALRRELPPLKIASIQKVCHCNRDGEIHLIKMNIQIDFDNGKTHILRPPMEITGAKLPISLGGMNDLQREALLRFLLETPTAHTVQNFAFRKPLILDLLKNPGTAPENIRLHAQVMEAISSSWDSSRGTWNKPESIAATLIQKQRDGWFGKPATPSSGITKEIFETAGIKRAPSAGAGAGAGTSTKTGDSPAAHSKKATAFYGRPEINRKLDPAGYISSHDL